MKQAQRQERSRREILQAAMEEFGTYNYSDVTIDNICSRHGISKGMMYHYYSGKDDLFLLCAREMFQALKEHMDTLPFPSPGQTDPEAIRELFRAREAYFETRPLEKHIFENVLFNTPGHLAGQLNDLRLPLRELNRQRFRQAVSQMELRAPLDEEAVSRYLECIESLFWPLVNQYQGGESIGDLPSLEAVSTQVLDMVLFGIVRQER